MPSLIPRVRAALFAGVCLAAACGEPSMAQPPTTPPAAPATSPPLLSLGQALAAAATTDPERAVTAARLAAEQAAVRAAGVKPNPELSAELENFAGTGPYLFDRFEATVSYEKTLERGGKREARTARAQAELPLVRLRGEIRQLDHLKEVQLAFAEVMEAEAKLLVAEARLISATQAQAQIDRRVKAARDPLFAGSRAEVLTAQAEIARDAARSKVRMAKIALAALTGGSADFSIRLEDFFEAPVQARADGRAAPDIELIEAERDVVTAQLRLAQSGNVADPKVRAGVRWLNDGPDVAVVVGGSIPLGVARSNEAAVRRAEAGRAVVDQEIAVARQRREREIARLSDRMNALSAEAERIRAEVIPHALRTVDQVLEGFARGGFEYNDVNQAETALVDARMRRVDLLAEYHRLGADRDRLTAVHRPLLSTLEERR